MLQDDKNTDVNNEVVPVAVESAEADVPAVVNEVNQPAPTPADDNKQIAEPRVITRIDNDFVEQPMSGGYATVKGTRKSDNRLVWIVIIVMTIMCCAVGVCSSVLTGYFMRRGEKPVKINTTYKYEAISAVVETRKPCVVEIEAGSAHGSGVITKLENNKIYILTNYHVIEGNEKNIKVRFMGADVWYIDVSVLGYDAGADVAVLTIASSTAPFEIIQLDGSDSFTPNLAYMEGDIVVAIGNAMGHGIAAYDGIISRASELITKNGDTAVPVLRTTAAINAGMSGGALFDAEGRFVGLGTYRMANYLPGSSDSNYDVEDTGYVVPVSIVYPLYKQILEYGNGGQIDRLLDISFSNTKLLTGSKTAVGAVKIFTPGFGGFTAEYRNGGKLTVIDLDGVNPASGIRVGDVIKSIGVGDNTFAVTSNICSLYGELLRYRQNSYKGSKLAFNISRDGGDVTVTVEGFFRLVD